MKTLLITIALLIPITAHGQLSNSKAQSYANEVFEMASGYIEEYKYRDGGEFAIGYTSEHSNFSTLRSMIGLIATTNQNIEVVQSWTRKGDSYQYGVAIDRKYVMVVHYIPESNGLIVGYVEAESNK